ncbi:hypothetical protein Pcinc_000112 [Petrolisthes cinctipes]|uniref:Uncharacterized protein n=1 Tax=Petrolisthes cinctipes TaxID=88211 RepID=A0AAE1GNV8_PETCI|nr:hypothetical protein Pcinc_000112 [Petrolisthes cinctipes]
MKYSYSGWLTQVNIWGRVLTQKEISALAGCHYDMEGDVMSWSGPWRHHGVEEEDIRLVELCTSVSRGRLTVPLPLLRYTDAVQVCLGLRGYIAVPTTRQQFLEEIGFFQDFVGAIHIMKSS